MQSLTNFFNMNWKKCVYFSLPPHFQLQKCRRLSDWVDFQVEVILNSVKFRFSRPRPPQNCFLRSLIFFPITLISGFCWGLELLSPSRLILDPSPGCNLPTSELFRPKKCKVDESQCKASESNRAFPFVRSAEVSHLVGKQVWMIWETTWDRFFPILVEMCSSQHYYHHHPLLNFHETTVKLQLLLPLFPIKVPEKLGKTWFFFSDLIS